MSDLELTQIDQLVGELTHESFPKSTRDVINLLRSKNIFSDSEANNFLIVWDEMKVTRNIDILRVFSFTVHYIS